MTTEKTRIPAVRSAAHWLRRFCRSQDGSWTVEAVIWTPIYLMLSAVAVNVSLAFHNESKVLYALQNVTRAHSLGRYGIDYMPQDDAAALADLDTQLAFFDAPYLASVDSSGALVRFTIEYEPVDLMTMGFLTGAFEGFKMTLVAEQLKEL